MRRLVILTVAVGLSAAVTACDKQDQQNTGGTGVIGGSSQLLKDDPGPTPEPKEKATEPRDPRTGETASEKADREAREKERERNPGGCDASGNC